MDWFRDLKQRIEKEFEQVAIYLAATQIFWL